MDFQTAFFQIDTDFSGEITKEELEDYMRKMKYKETFVERWLNIFDMDNSGTISYEEYCQTLGLVPRQEDIDKIESVKVAEGGGESSGAKKGPKESEEVSEEVVTKKKTVGARSAPPMEVDEDAVQSRKTTRMHAAKPKKAATTPSKDGKGACRAAESRNSVISKPHNLMRFSRARVLEKKALYRVKPGTVRSASKRESKGGNDVRMTEKAVGGERNGEKRMVPSARVPRAVDSQLHRRKSGRVGHSRCFSEQKHRLRASIQPGTVLILLSGPHRGKRVVFLKQMTKSGLLLVTGPFKMNGCPLRRVNQRFVIATQTRLALDDVNLPDRLTDEYFRRIKAEKKSRDEGDIYQKNASSYELTAERKEDQKIVDSAVLSVISKHGDAQLLRGYLRNQFSLKSGDRPHSMKF